MTLVRWNLFTHREQWTWIDDPFETPALEPTAVLLALAMGRVGQHEGEPLSLEASMNLSNTAPAASDQAVADLGRGVRGQQCPCVGWPRSGSVKAEGGAVAPGAG